MLLRYKGSALKKIIVRSDMEEKEWNKGKILSVFLGSRGMVNRLNQFQSSGN